MSCYHPLKGFVVGITDTGKRKIFPTSYDADHVECLGPNGDSPVAVYEHHFSDNSYSVHRNYIELPCGRCIGCRLKYSRDWADRCIMEMPYHESSFFVTLTYDNEHIPVNPYFESMDDMEDGVCLESPTLRPIDVSLFIKKLRRHLDYHCPDHAPISYFACGEYGDLTHRPHYHLIIFGLQLQDLEFYKKSKLGFNYYNSHLLTSLWQKGHVVVADCNWQTCAYVARYILKKQTGPKSEIYKLYNYEPEFCRMSRRPAIGRRFFEDHFDELYGNDFVSIATAEGGHKVRPNRYFDKLYEKLDPDKYSSIKQKRSDFAKVTSELKLARTDKSYLSLLQAEEDNLIERIQTLTRKDI